MLGKLLSRPSKPLPEEVTRDLIAQAWLDWQTDHPGATLRDFWAAVGAGDVDLPPN